MTGLLCFVALYCFIAGVFSTLIGVEAETEGMWHWHPFVILVLGVCLIGGILWPVVIVRDLLEEFIVR